MLGSVNKKTVHEAFKSMGIGYVTELDMIYKGIKIDKLFVSSYIQRQTFVNSFFWPKKTVKVIPSLRFKQLDNREKTIFLPFIFS
jgi:hypothetical protein